MTTDTDTDTTDQNDTPFLTRRKAIAGLALGLGGGTAIAAETGIIPDSGGDNSLLEDPSRNATTPTDEPFITPWDTNELTVTVVVAENATIDEFFELIGYRGIRNAVDNWNDYIQANAAFDLSLTFSPDISQDDADIALRQTDTMVGQCLPQYDLPTGSLYIHSACVTTLTETPSSDDLPLTATISRCNFGESVYRITVRHVIGRLLGYDIWTQPQDVMTPHLLTKLSMSATGGAGASILSYPGTINRSGSAAELSHAAEKLQNALPEAVDDALTFARTVLQMTLKRYLGSERTEFFNTIEKYDLEFYREAYNQFIAADITRIKETISAINSLLNSDRSNEAIASSNELSEITSTLNTLGTEFKSREAPDLEIHRYVMNQLWTSAESPNASNTTTTTSTGN